MFLEGHKNGIVDRIKSVWTKAEYRRYSSLIQSNFDGPTTSGVYGLVRFFEKEEYRRYSALVHTD